MKASATSIPAPVIFLDVLPSFPALYSAYLLMAHAKITSYFSNFFTIGETFSNLGNLIGIKFCAWRSFAQICSSMPNSILHVCRCSVIPEIAQSIIGWIAIIMTGNKTFWLWANKGKHYYVMNANDTYAKIFTQRNMLPTVNFVSNWFKNLAFDFSKNPTMSYYGAIKTSNFSKVGCLVKPFIARNWLPNFLHKNLHLLPLIIVSGAKK